MYSLYYTLNKKIPKKDFPKKKVSSLLEKLASLDDQQAKAVLLLIVEYAKVEDKFKINFKRIKVPYDGLKDRSSVTFDIENFPMKLKWILWKFCKI